MSADYISMHDDRPIVEQHLPKILVGAIICAAVIVLTALYPNDNKENPLPLPWSYISAAVGWIYFFAWSISFYFQVLLNYDRKSTIGLSYDFAWLNFVGFCGYAIYNIAYFYSDFTEPDGKKVQVEVQDLLFAVHAAAICFFILCQMYLMGYESRGMAISFRAKLYCIISVGIGLVLSVGTLIHGEGDWNKDSSIFENIFTWPFFLHFLGINKMVITCIKYVPQTYLNFVRKSTVGWSMGNVLLDFTGGSMSVAQVVINGLVTKNWGSVIPNPVKFGLGFVSMFFDVVFMIQHFVLYPNSSTVLQEDESEMDPMLEHNDSQRDTFQGINDDTSDSDVATI